MRTTMNGTPFFCSPEMLNHRQYNYKHDMYSLGVTLYHLTSLALPFSGDTISEILRCQKMKKPKKLPRFYSAELRSIIESMMHKDQDMRPSIR
jgi:NIMA (never in mitosis gene a)-related kinase